MGEITGNRTRRALSVAVVLLALAGAVPARAAELAVFTNRSTFLPGDDETGAPIVIPAGTGMSLTNLDAFAAHALTSDEMNPDGSRLFGSDSLNFRASAPVVGVADLPAGTYGFHCSVHEDNMHGTLVVL